MALGIDTHVLDQSNMQDVIDCFLVVTFGSTAIASYFGKGVTLVRNSPGNYTGTIQKSYRKFVDWSPGWYRPSGLELGTVISASTVDTDGKFTFETRNASGTATDPTSGDILYLRFALSDNQFNEKFGG